MTLEQTAEEQVGKYLASARRWASQGEAHTMECALRIVGRYAVSVEREKEISAERTAIEAIGYAAAVPVQLASARRWASQGEAHTMECALSTAEKYAAKSGIDISTKRREIEAIGYAAAVPVQLADASRWASEGNTLVMECALSIAERCAAQAGRDISAERTAIEATGYAAALRVNLEMAAERASQGQDYSMECALIVAERYAAKSGMDISAQAAEITASLKTRGGK